jgi:cysteinyl-tRNA synthetase
VPLEQARVAFAEADGVLDIGPGVNGAGMGEEPAAEAEFAEWVEGRLAERRTARAARDFAASDRIRDELVAAGVELKDTGKGTVWRRVR